MTAVNRPGGDLAREIAELRQLVAATRRHPLLVPHIAADPVVARDGMVWIRSDTRQLCWRAAGVTHRAGP